MKQYLKESLDKFRKDILSKFFYDVTKWLVLSIVLVAIARYAEFFQLRDWLTKSFQISVFTLILLALGVIALTAFFLRLLFQRKYQALEKDNFTDELTGLKNHKAFKKELVKRIGEVSSSGGKLSIIMLDIDDFKAFNTTYGFTIADAILAKVGVLLSNDRRITDEIYRQFLRGDEFVIVASNTSANEAFMAAERKRRLIASTTFVIKEEPFQLTVSCGVTEYAMQDTLESLTQRAVSALGKSKEKIGKNNSSMVI